ncbi:MAG: peptidase M15 [Burkholderiales bacterium]|nr:peptidase M15 [Burkholderiales bacterium]
MRRALALALVLAQGAVHADEPRTADSFKDWRVQHEAAVAAFEALLVAQGLAEVAPLHQLLRSASDWQRCGAEPYAVPPEAQWPAALSTLRLLRTLRSEAVLGAFEIHSAHRDAALNACAGGAPRSTHLVAFAVDLVPLDDAQAGARLCRYWARHGQGWQMGLSRYPSGRIHIDTWRYRTWGADHSARSSFCAAESEREAAPDAAR